MPIWGRTPTKDTLNTSRQRPRHFTQSGLKPSFFSIPFSFSSFVLNPVCFSQCFLTFTIVQPRIHQMQPQCREVARTYDLYTSLNCRTWTLVDKISSMNWGCRWTPYWMELLPASYSTAYTNAFYFLIHLPTWPTGENARKRNNMSLNYSMYSRTDLLVSTVEKRLQWN